MDTMKCKETMLDLFSNLKQIIFYFSGTQFCTAVGKGPLLAGCALCYVFRAD